MEKRSFYYRMIRGAIGKKFVVKHYKGGKMVVTRFPDMSGIVPTEKQKVRRDLFREAVVWAKWVIADEERKLAFRNTLPRKKRKKVYQAALQMYMKMKGSKVWLSKQWAMGNGQLANIENQGVLCFVDVRKQLAEKAIMENDNWLLRGKGLLRKENGNEVPGYWRIMWRKRIHGFELAAMKT